MLGFVVFFKFHRYALTLFWAINEYSGNIIEILEDFSLKAKNRAIDITLISERGTVKNPESFIEFFNLRPRTA